MSDQAHQERDIGSFGDFVAEAANAFKCSQDEIYERAEKIDRRHNIVRFLFVKPPGEGRCCGYEPSILLEPLRDFTLVDKNELRNLFEKVYGLTRAPETHEAASAQTAGAEARCRRHLVEIMRASPQRATMCNADLKRDMQKQFPGLGERAFARAKEAAIDEAGTTAWRAPGRKPGH